MATTNKILLCDDDRDISTLIEIITEPMNIDLSIADTIEDIESLVLMEAPNLILMDLSVPVIGGEEAVRKLKNNLQTKEIPILLFSASDDLEDICQKVGADGCIKKPFNVEQLRSVFREYLSK